MRECYSLNDEEFYQEVDLLNLGDFDVGEVLTVAIRQMKPYYPCRQTMANVLVERMAQNTFDDLGEGTAVDWCDMVHNLDTEDLQEELERAMLQWLMDHKCATVLWQVVGKKSERDIVVTEDGWEWV